MLAMEKKEEHETAKRALRDSMYTSRYADSSKAKIMGQGIKDAAMLTGLSASGTAWSPSPYRLS